MTDQLTALNAECPRENAASNAVYRAFMKERPRFKSDLDYEVVAALRTGRRLTAASIMAEEVRVYRQWIWANAWSELIGLGGTMLIGFLVFSGLNDADPLVVVGGAVFAVVAGAALEGGVVGFAQARVLNRFVPTIVLRSWVWATVIGAGTAWFLGMIPSTAFALAGPPQTDSASQGPEGLAMLGMAAGLGLVLGPVLSFPQAIVLRTAVARPWTWIVANAVAWAVGMAVIFGGMSVVSPESATLEVATVLLIMCLAAGATVGVLHGWWLVRMLRPPGRVDAVPPPGS